MTIPVWMGLRMIAAAIEKRNQPREETRVTRPVELKRKEATRWSAVLGADPAISLTADSETDIYLVNPGTYMGGSLHVSWKNLDDLVEALTRIRDERSQQCQRSSSW